MIWLFRFKFAGRTWYLSSLFGAVETPRRSGVEIPHRPTLTVSGFAESVEIGGGVAGPCTADLTFKLDRDGWSYFLDGHRLESVWGELSLWEPGTDYAERHVLLTGRIETDAQDIPRDAEPFTATLTQRVIDTATPWPSPTDVVTLEAWPNAPNDDTTADVIGDAYPWPIGLMGPFTDASGQTKYASTTPVIVVDDTAAAEVGCIAGAPVAATTVTIWNATQKTDASFAVSTTIDGTGIARATVDLGSAPAPWAVDGTEALYVTDWGEGGLLTPYGASAQVAATGLGDAIVYLLAQRYDTLGPEAIDFGAWAALAPVLNGWKVGLAAETGDPMDIITQRLLPLCPALWLCGGPSGWRPVYFGETPAVESRLLTVGRDIFTSEVRPSLSALLPVNQVTTTFAPSTNAGRNRGTITMGPDNSPQAAASVTRHGNRIEQIDGSATFDRGTAALAAMETIRLRWTRPFVMAYDAPSRTALGLRLGQRVRVTDESLGLTDQLFWVLSRDTDDGTLWQIVLFATR